MKLTKEAPINIDNIYEAFEDSIYYVINYTIEECYDFEEHKQISEDMIKYIEENEIIEKSIAYIINKLELHLINQLNEYNSIQVISFFEKQRLFYKSYFPENRKKEINKIYLLNISNGDERILENPHNYSVFDKKFLNLLFKKYTKYYDVLKLKLESLSQKYDSSTNIQFEDTNDFDINYFNQRTYNLFKYLVENYNKEYIVKYINIFTFLKKSVAKENPTVFRFTMTQEEYKAFIKEKYDIQIKKFANAQFKYEDEELPKLNDLFIKFKRQ